MTVPTYTPDTAVPEASTAAESTAQTACPACAHPLADHDPIGVRFCRATVAGAFERGCICRVG
jgi:hypothetical protein